MYQSKAPTVAPHTLLPVHANGDTPPVYTPDDIHSGSSLPRNAKDAMLHQWHLALNNSKAQTIHVNLQQYNKPDKHKISHAHITSTACYKGKFARAPHKSTTHNIRPVQVLSADIDIARPISPTGDLSEKYLPTFSDIACGYSFVMPIRRKGDPYEAVVTAIQYTMKIFGRPTAVLISNNAKEYLSAAIQEATRTAGNATPSTITHIPEKNGILGRLKRTLINAVHCVLAAANIPEP